MQYFVLVDLGYDGIVVSKFRDETEADKYYCEQSGRISRDEEGLVSLRSGVFAVALIEGRLLKEEEFSELR